MKTNNLTVKQLIEIRDSLNKFDPETDHKFKSVKDMAIVIEKTLGFKVTPANLARVFREFELDKSDYIQAGSSNSLITQLANLRERMDEQDRRIAELEAMVVANT